MANNMKKYVKPTVSSEEIFEKNVLACTKASRQTQSCAIGTLHDNSPK